MTCRRARHGPVPGLKYAALALACGVALGATVWAQPTLAAVSDASADASSGSFAEFDRSMLAGGNKGAASIARFEHGDPVLPGIYNLDVYLNKNEVGRMDVHFAAASSHAGAVPCATPELLDRLGLTPTDSSAVAQLQSPNACVELVDLIPGAKLSFDMSDLRLDASVPQAYLGQMPRGYVNPASWNAGATAFLLDYNFNTYHTTSIGQAQTSTYLGLRAGLNVGRWQLRQDSTATWQSGVAGQPGQRHWQNIDAYAQRALPKLRATFTVGDSYTDGAVFDSFGLRGIQLASDDRMLPQSMRGYAPVVRGVADSNAEISVRQNGVEIYQATVAPGAFVIRDLYPTGYGGDLEVTVTEADGRRHGFSVPYASVAQLLRPGITRFDVSAGQLRDTSLQRKPGVIQTVMQHGFDNLVSSYAGVQGSEGYAAALIGSAFNMGLGAVAVDLTQSRANIPGYGIRSGRSFRIGYSKILPNTDTALNVAAYRYSTSGFLGLKDAEAARDYARRGLDILQYVPVNVPMIDGVPVQSLLTPAERAALAGTAYMGDNLFTTRGLLRQRDRFTLTLSQRVGNSGSLYANASINDYWNRSGRDTQFQVGYNNHFRRLAWGVSVTRSRLALGGYDDQFFLNSSLPLGDRTHAPNLSSDLSHSGAAGSEEQAMLNGTAGESDQFAYGATASHGGDGIGNAVSVNAGYRGPYAVLDAGVSQGSGYSQKSFSASGAVVAHSGGITFGQPIGDTVAIVYVPGADGAHITNAPGVRVDRFGYALVPYLVPYQLDTLQIDPLGLPLGVQEDATSAQVAPYAGAVVLVNFKSKNGRAMIAHIRMADGKPAPFGAQVFGTKDESIGVVGQGGLALLRGVAESGQLSVRWQDEGGAAQTCAFPYALPVDARETASYRQIRVTCIMSVAASRPAVG